MKDSLKLRKDSFEYNVELQFIREKEIESYKEHIDNDLRIDIGDRNFEKVKDQTPNEKVQLLIKLEKYNNIDQEKVIENILIRWIEIIMTIILNMNMNNLIILIYQL